MSNNKPTTVPVAMWTGSYSRQTPDQRVQQLEAQLAAQTAHFEKYKTGSNMGVGAILSITDEHVFVSRGTDIHRLIAPPEFFLKEKLVPGDRVAISSEGVVCARVDIPPMGPPMPVKAVLSDGYEITNGQETRVVLKGRVVAEVGHRILIDPGGMVAIATLGAPRSLLEASPDIRVLWDDVGGQDEAKRKLREAVIDPIENAELLKEFGKTPTKGVLLYGPPGVGKTLLAKAVATALADIHGASAGSFIYVKGPEIVSKWIGETESNIRNIFTRSREFFREHGHRCVVFIDEADSVMGKRGDMGDQMTAHLQRSIIAAFLSEMDGLTDNGAITILSTNRPGDLDSAVTRDGRIDERIEVKRPTMADSTRIFALNLRGKKVVGDVGELADNASTMLFDEKHVIRNAPAGKIHLSAIVSGSLIAGIVQKATQRAINSAKVSKKGKPGIGMTHLAEAIEESCLQARHTNHDLAGV